MNHGDIYLFKNGLDEADKERGRESSCPRMVDSGEGGRLIHSTSLGTSSLRSSHMKGLKNGNKLSQ